MKCQACQNKARFLCNGCKKHKYCSYVCQEIDWEKNHKTTCLIGTSSLWNYEYHPFVVRIDDNNVRFDYVLYYKLDIIKQQGQNISISVIDKPWGKPDKFDIFGPMKELAHDGQTLPLQDVKSLDFHGIMCSTLINGRRNDNVNFLGGSAPKSFVYLISSESQITKEDTFIMLSTAAKRSHIISRSGLLQLNQKREIGEEQKQEDWTTNDSLTLLNILEKYDSVLIISAGNDPKSIIGNTVESQWMNQLVLNKSLMRRVLVVANFRPLHPNIIERDVNYAKMRKLINKYPNSNANEIDDAIMIQMAKDNDINPIHMRATLRKTREKYTSLNIPFDVHALNQMLDNVTQYRHYSNYGAVVSYEAGIMQNHCVFVAGCDIYAPGRLNKLESNDGSSESTPIMAGIFARFIEKHRKGMQDQTYADILDIFKKEYTKPVGDAAVWGLGVPNIEKMFF